MKEIKELSQKIDELEINCENGVTNELEEEANNLIEKIEDLKPRVTFFEEKDLNKLLNRIRIIKKENRFYNEEDELDRMLPNRHDEDFDHDSMEL